MLHYILVLPKVYVWVPLKHDQIFNIKFEGHVHSKP